MTALSWVGAIWLGLVVSAIAGIGIRSCLFHDLDPVKAPWQVRWTYRIGQGLVAWTVIVIVIGLIMLTKRWIQTFC